MNRNKDSSPLFDMIHGPNTKKANQGVSLPKWMQKNKAESHPKPPVDDDTDPCQDQPPASTSGLLHWFQTPVVFHLRRGVILAASMFLIILISLAAVLGHKAGVRTAHQLEADYNQSLKSISAIIETTPIKPLIPSHVAGIDPSLPGVPLTNAPRSAAMLSIANDPRQPGFNYYILITLPASASQEAAATVEFLRANGFDSAPIPVDNGKSLKLVVLQGFEPPLSRVEVRTFTDQLKKLGRIWKAEHKGSSDWRDMYAERYKPSRN